ncbi:amino acid adenylation domain-containing protein [Bacillus cereus]|uniref:Amino acid adenylation domain-containing protein n=1 Tax=Bacillus cereus HuA3-9 TaxID=1053205 RepID=R8CX17_BACCE|nr:non-ribosomal peptide synthetase [Bacillus cereus]EOO16136.1 amino acid adenylation domain-containing protein [Bacillus cereus HuA3-9]
MNNKVSVQFPLSYGQKAFWFQHQSSQKAPFNHLNFAARIVSGFHPERFRCTLEHLFQKYESLRTRFIEKDGELYQEVANDSFLPYEEIDARALNTSAILNKITEAADAPYDLEAGALMRAKLYRCENGEFVFFLGFHHICVDLWSMTEFIQDLGRAYMGDEIEILAEKERVNNYAEFVEYQSAIVDGAKGEKLWDHWKMMLGNDIPILQMPEDFQRPEIKTYQAETIRFELPDDLEKNIRSFTKENGFTIYSFLLAAYMVLLHRYSGQEDIVVGSPFAGRTSGKFRKTFGFFVNMLVNRQHISSTLPFKDLVIDVNRNAGKNLRKQDLPFPILAQKFNSQRDNSRSPLYDIEFVYDRPRIIEDIAPFIQGRNGTKLHLGELVLESIELDKRWLERDLQLFVSDSREKLYCTLTYNKDLFLSDTATKFVDHFINLVTSVIQEPEISIGSINLFSQKERSVILNAWNQTKRDYHKEGWVHDWLSNQANKSPDRIALNFEGRELSYKELDKKIQNVTNRLSYECVRNESPVAIVMNRSIEMVTAIHGILRSGGYYIPIDPELPEERIVWMLSEVQAEIILTQEALYPFLERLGYGEKAIILDDENEKKTHLSELEVNSENAAYMIYTSGSTSRPKGVVNTHGGIRNRILWMQEAFQLSSDDCILQKTPYSFDVSVWEFLWPFMAGAKLVVAKPEGHKDPDYLIDLIKKESITTIHFVPSMLKVFLANPRSSECISLRRVICSGEALPTSLSKEFFEILPWCELHNLYGPTEAAVDVTWWKCEPSLLNRSVPIGFPIANTQMYILDKMLNPVPIGVSGDLYIGGCQLARGYWQRPDLTADRFIPNPFDQEEGNRIYKTGDIARYLKNGAIEYLGRSDFQVKIRGFRIELEEIEAHLLNLNGVKEAVVSAKENEGEQYLCAYLVSDIHSSVSELREYLSKHLPEYMIPSYFVYMDKMPLTPNGKLDRKALPEPEKSANMGVEYLAPTNEVEEKLVEVYQQVLGVSDIGINHDFFELGGHSLKATVLISKIHKELDVKLPLSEVFTNSKIKDLAKYIEKLEQNIYTAIQQVETKEYYPTSSAQKRLYMLEQIQENVTSYNMPGAMMIEGILDRNKFEQAFRQLIQRHETLRTSFDMVDDEIVQKVHGDVEFEISFIETHEDMNDEIMSRFVRLFDLSKAPLLRIGLVKFAENKHMLLFDMHHIISDGVSMGLLVEEFVHLYQGNQLSPLRIQYKDFSVWQNELFQSQVIKEKEQYWLNTFQGEIPVLNMPTDFPRPSIQSFEGCSTSFDLDKELTENLNALAKETGTTLYMVLLAAYNVLLSKYTGQEDIVVGSPVAGRPHADLQSIIGMFVNTLAMRNYPKSNQTFEEFLDGVKENALIAYENQDYQFEQLVERLEIPRDMSRNPLFDTMFVLQNADNGKFTIDGLKFKPYSFDSMVTKFDLTLTAREIDEKITFNFGYCTKLFERETIERMANHLINILKQIVVQKDIELAQMDMLSRDEKRQLLLEFNDTKLDYPSNKAIHELFEEQVKKTPNHVAVVFGNKQLTYKELNSRANILARLLRKKGVRPNSIVSIKTPRSIELAVGIMGILKAGGAYLPIDPQYPVERISYMLEDSGSKVFLTSDYLKEKIHFDGVVIDINELPESIEDENLQSITQSNDLAYVIYTSGSTGKPKGVMLEHKSLVNFIFSMYHSYGQRIGVGDNCLSITNISFDVSVCEFFLPLTFGASLVLYDNIKFVDPKELAQTIVDKSISFAYIPPTLLSDVYKDIRLMGRDISLDKLLVGVEPIKDQTLENYLKLNKSMKILNGYGPTEATICATFYEYQGGIITGRNVPIGKPLKNTNVYIMNSGLLTPIGVAGELCVAGDGLASGYLNRRELTEEKFISNPFGNGRLYKTGDLARWRSDGNIEFLGRSDFQVKMRGFRIELGEIEASLESLISIRQAVVKAWDDESQGMYLAAYLIYEEGQSQYTIGELRKQLAQSLPNYMIPLHFIALEEIPISANGKVDRKSLPRPLSHVDSGERLIQNYNEIEEKLAPLWFNLIGQKPVAQDHFFESGGHSLLVMRLVSKIQEAFNVKLAVSDIFSNPTFEDIARLIEVGENIPEKVMSLPEIQKPNSQLFEFPLSFAQQRLWFLDQLNPGSSNYNMVGAFKLSGSINPKHLKEVFLELTSRHDILRTTFGSRDGIPYQLVGVKPQISFNCVEFRDNQDVNSLIMDEARFGFNLEEGPLIRVLLITNINNLVDENILVVNMHHIISDGWSMNVLIQEIGELWSQIHSKKSDYLNLPKLVIQYGDYSLWQKNLMESGYFANQISYWQQHLGGHKGILGLPVDKPRSTTGVGKAGEIPIRISENELIKLKNLANANGCTLYMLLITAYAVVLNRYSGDEDIIIGTAVANRNRSELEGLIGFFVNTLGIRLDFSDDLLLSELLEKSRESVLDGFANEDVPFDVVLDSLNVPRLPGIHPLFQAMFILQTASPTEMSLSGVEINPMHLPMEESKFDLFLNLEEKKGELVGHLKFNLDIFNEERIRKMGEYFTSFLEACLKNPDKKISELKASLQAERPVKPVLTAQDLRGLLSRIQK